MSIWARYFAWSDRNRFAVDAAVAGLVGLVVVPTSSAIVAWGEEVNPIVWLVAGVMSVAMAWRRIQPVASAVVVYIAALIHLLVLGWPLILPADLLVAWALWSLTVHGPQWANRVGLAGAGLGALIVGVEVAWDFLTMLSAATVVGLAFLATWSSALARRARREAMDALIDRAERLELERDQQTRLGAATERARIAREMHDIVAHSLSVIVAQADGGRYASNKDPEAPIRALGTISETGRAALTDMRRLLGVLRAVPGEESAPTTGPVPAVEDIASLVDQLRSGGMRVSLVRLGNPRPLPPGAGLTVYRIAQESLTNVLKHAGPDPEVTVLLQWLAAGVVLEISDDGRGAATDSDGLGQGLVGIRERAAMFGGEVSAGPQHGGGFKVRATLPMPGLTYEQEDS